jgi:hypothetical protein
MKLFPAWLFDQGDATNREQIFGWWARRLLYFNLAVGAVGFVTWWLVMIAGSAAVKPGVDFEEPLAMLFGPFVYAGFANLCYCLGPIFDLVIYSKKPRVWLFKAGLFFSLTLTALPGLWAVTAWLMTVVTGTKLD